MTRKLSSLIFTGALVALTAPAHAHASQDLIKSCSAQVNMGPESTEIQIRVLREADGSLIGKSRTGGTAALKQSAFIETHQVRAGLTAETEPDDLNRGEALVLHAMMLESFPEMQASAGVDLKKIREVTAYVVGLEEQGQNPIGMTAIVEARDEQGQALGSFLGGFLIGKCR